MSVARPSETTFVLVHSPLVGPATWEPVAHELTARGFGACVPDLGGVGESRPHWKRHAELAAAAMRGLPARERAVLVGHSGAGALLPAIRATSPHPAAGYVFVDAGLPDPAEPRAGVGAFAAVLADLHARGGRYPDWTDTDVREVIPDPARRRALLADLRPQPPDFWHEVVPVFEGWPDAPCGYLAFVRNDAYAQASADARARGWAHASRGRCPR